MHFDFEGTRFEDAFRPDLVNNGAVVVEVKAAAAPDPVFERQLLIFLRILDCRLRLLLNIGLPTIRAGIRRVIN